MAADEMDNEQDRDFARRVSGPLQARDTADPAFVERVMSGVRAATADMRADARRGWWRRSRTVQVSPLGALALAAGFALALLGVRELAPARAAAPSVAAAAADTVHLVRFVFLGAGGAARSVMLVGTFNDWDKSALPMARHESGAWSVSIPLAAGQHEYAFVVLDGARESWVADPAALRVRDEFGAETSVLSVGGST
jgi:hypothetical protein